MNKKYLKNPGPSLPQIIINGMGASPPKTGNSQEPHTIRGLSTLWFPVQIILGIKY
jgi:hypothetical protein